MPRKKSTTTEVDDADAVAKMLYTLRGGPKHRDWLRGIFHDPEALIKKLRNKGHVIKKVSLPFREWDWVYELQVKPVKGK